MMAINHQPPAALIIIGNEILSGRTADQNMVVVARWLTARGYDLTEGAVIPDSVARIAQKVNRLRDTHDLVITTGGIGPTPDDLTIGAIAEAFGVPVVLSDQAQEVMARYYEGRGLVFTEARRRMARIPQGARLIANPMTAAPGVLMANVAVLPGVPSILARMLPELARLIAPGIRRFQRSVVCCQQLESDLVDLLQDVTRCHPNVEVGSYPRWDPMGNCSQTTIVLRSLDAQQLARAVQDVAAGLTARNVEARWSEAVA